MSIEGKATTVSARKDRWRALITDSLYASSVPEMATRFENLEIVCPDEIHDVQELAAGQFDRLLRNLSQ